jgi:hypothetical protein
MVPAALNVLIIWFCPESPRWLYSVGKTEQARKVLAQLHSETGDINSPLIQLEMEEIIEKIQVDGPDSTCLSPRLHPSDSDSLLITERWWDFRPLFKTRPDRYRTGVIVFVGIFGQLSGNGLITYFLPVLLRTAGINSQTKRLALTFVNAITSFLGALSVCGLPFSRRLAF